MNDIDMKQVSKCCAKTVDSTDTPNGIRIFCRHCLADCEVEMIDPDDLEERQKEIALDRKLNAAKRTMRDAVAILTSKFKMTAWFEDFDQTIGVECRLLNGLQRQFIAGTANDRFDIQWHKVVGDVVCDVAVFECEAADGYEWRTLDIDAYQLAKWIFRTVQNTTDQEFYQLRHPNV